MRVLRNARTVKASFLSTFPDKSQSYFLSAGGERCIFFPRRLKALKCTHSLHSALKDLPLREKFLFSLSRA